jgi:hypothetical protein
VELAPKCNAPGKSWQCHEVRTALAIGSAKPRYRPRSAKGTGGRRPHALQPPRVGSCPHSRHRGCATQVVDVPVRAQRRMEVVHEASGEAARTEGAARVEIDWRFERNETEEAHPKPRGGGQFKEQRVGPWAYRESLLTRIHRFSPCRPTDRRSAAGPQHLHCLLGARRPMPDGTICRLGRAVARRLQCPPGRRPAHGR